VGGRKILLFFLYTFVFAVSYVSIIEHSERVCVVVEEKISPASVCDRVTFCLGIFSFRFTTDHSSPLFAVQP